MSVPAITQEDWSALARIYGEVCASELVWRRIAADREAELVDLRRQLAALTDELHKPPDGGD